MKTLLALIFFFVPLMASAEWNGQPDFNSYVAVGPAFAWPGSIRIGYDSWEIGLLNMGLGFDKILRSDWKYVAFGLEYGVGAPVAPGIGFFGAVGGEWNLFWGLTVRAELNAAALNSGYVNGSARLGLGLHI